MSPNSERILEYHASNPCGSSLLLSLPDDVAALVSRSLNPVDLCNLSLCCRSLNGLAASDKIWFVQCEKLESIDTQNLLSWRKAVDSYKALCKFLLKVKPLIGIWVHQNPELGNVVYVMWGFMSVVGCRIIPQELSPLGFDGPLLWAPVFEIVGDSQGSTLFFLHGRERDRDYCYPGSFKGISQQCNVLLLEAEPRKVLAINAVGPNDMHTSRKICGSERVGSSSSSRREPMNDLVPFSKLAFGDRRNLLELVADHVRMEIPECANGPLFPQLGDSMTTEDEFPVEKDAIKEEFLLLSQRRSLLIEMYKFGNSIERKTCSDSGRDAAQLDSGSRNWCDATGLLKAFWERSSIECAKGQKARSISSCSVSRHLSFDDKEIPHNMKGRRSIAGYFKNGFKQIVGKATGNNDGSTNTSCVSSRKESKKVQLYEFLRHGSSVELSLRASTMKLSSYHAWPIMPDNKFALYKLPQPLPKMAQEFAGLWGGTFGWPPGRPTEDKPGKALFFLLLSYEESEDGKLLIATKILEGTHYVLHPNGSAMFVVNMNEPSSDSFPWDRDEQSLPISVDHAYHGEGIANGYGFRYPGSKPGALFVLQTGLLAFVWRETRAVLTLRRLNLQTLLGRGEQIAALPPIANFAYLTKSYSNVFVGFAGSHSL